MNMKLSEIKELSGRNLDNLVDSNTLTSGEQADGTFGVFKFFQGIKNFFKGIQALGTLASGSRLPVTDANGNVTYTTMNDINSYVVKNALTEYKLTDFNPSSYSDDNSFYKGLVARAFAIKGYAIVSGEILWQNHWFGFVKCFATSSTSGTVEVTEHSTQRKYLVKVNGDSVTSKYLTNDYDFLVSGETRTFESRHVYLFVNSHPLSNGGMWLYAPLSGSNLTLKTIMDNSAISFTVSNDTVKAVYSGNNYIKVIDLGYRF